jgi:hypothetical protein
LLHLAVEHAQPTGLLACLPLEPGEALAQGRPVGDLAAARIGVHAYGPGKHELGGLEVTLPSLVPAAGGITPLDGALELAPGGPGSLVVPVSLTLEPLDLPVGPEHARLGSVLLLSQAGGDVPTASGVHVGGLGDIGGEE